MIRLSLILILLLKLQLSCSFSKTSKSIHGSFKLKSLGNSIISSQDSYALLAAMTGSAALGLKLEKDTSFGKSLSAPVCAMIITAIMTNTGILPSNGAPFISSTQSFVVKLASPLLLLGADIKKIVRETGPVLKAFLVGTIGTLLGSTIAYIMLYRYFPVGVDWKIASAITAKNIGGGLNFMAVSDILNIPNHIIGLGLAIDNLLGLVYFPLMSWLANPYKVNEISSMTDDSHNRESSLVSPDNMIFSLSISAAINAISEYIGNFFNFPVLLISTSISIILATLFSKQFVNLVPSGDACGKVLLLIFFGSIGNSMGLLSATLATSGVAFFALYGLILYFVHILTVLLLGKKFNLSIPDLLLASNANIGNHATASSFAASNGWNKKILPAMLVGTFGNSIGTFLGLGLGYNFLKYF